MTTPAPVPVAVVVLTFNEAANLERCLSSVSGWCREIHVVDSGSTDTTAEIARRLGAVVSSHPFSTHARQWSWALETLAIEAPWILALDADQHVSPELRGSIERAVTTNGQPEVDGYYVCRKQVFRGRWIRHGGYYPMYLLKLFRRGRVSLDEWDLVDHHFHVRGRVGRLSGDLVEDNANEHRIADWVSKHNRYARLLAQEELSRQEGGDSGGRLLGHRNERVRAAKGVWRRLPLYLRPFLYFTYRYVLRLGFLDGKEGFVFHFLQAWWYRLLVDINREELLRERGQ